MGMAKSAVWIIGNYKGSFTAPMGFNAFPYDVQHLPVELILVHGNDIVRC